MICIYYILSLLKRLSKTSMAICQSHAFLVCVNVHGTVLIGQCLFHNMPNHLNVV